MIISYHLVRLLTSCYEYNVRTCIFSSQNMNQKGYETARVIAMCVVISSAIGNLKLFYSKSVRILFFVTRSAMCLQSTLHVCTHKKEHAKAYNKNCKQRTLFVYDFKRARRRRPFAIRICLTLDVSADAKTKPF